jgi:hypothetical protein
MPAPIISHGRHRPPSSRRATLFQPFCVNLSRELQRRPSSASPTPFTASTMFNCIADGIGQTKEMTGSDRPSKMDCSDKKRRPTLKKKYLGRTTICHLTHALLGDRLSLATIIKSRFHNHPHYICVRSTSNQPTSPPLDNSIRRLLVWALQGVLPFIWNLLVSSYSEPFRTHINWSALR